MSSEMSNAQPAAGGADGGNERVAIRIEAGVADVRLNRPDKLNALDPPMFEALVEAGTRLRSEPGLRAVVLSGEGRGFCAGLDFASFSSMAAPDAGRGIRQSLGRREGGPANRGQQAAWVWAELPVPVIAAVHGVAFGGGLQIALAADVRIVAPDSRLSVLEIRWGLIPDMTGTYVLPRLVGPDVAKELAWTGRTVEGAEAARIGLATRVADDPRREALALAHVVASHSPDAVRAAKALFNRSLEAGPDEQFPAEAAAMGALIGSPNQSEAVHAYFERRQPRFVDPGTSSAATALYQP